MDDPRQTSAENPPDAVADPRWSARLQAGVGRRWRTTKAFGRELMHEHEFWVNTLAVKGGASAIVVAGVVGISYVVALPFMVAATGIAACGALIGLGAYGMVAGAARSWWRLQKMYAKATGKPEPKRPEKSGPNWVERQCQKPLVQKLLKQPVMKAFLNSRAWRLTKKFTIGQQDNVLGGLAVGGAVLSLAIGATLLATQIIVLPVVAVGSLLTVATVSAASYLVTGISGLYFSITGMRHIKEKRRAQAAAAQAKAADAQNASNTPLPAPEGADALPASPAADFDKAAQTPAATPPAAGNDNPPKPPAADAAPRRRAP